MYNMKTIDSLHELLKHELKDLYSAETQIIEALPAMIERAGSKKLKTALEDHLAVTNKQKKRLEKIQELLNDENDTQPEEKKGFFANLFKSKEGEEHCKAMEGLVKEGNSLLKEDMTQEVMDAGIIAACQKIEHYEISSYGTAKAYALQLHMATVAAMLEETLNEEYFADDSLTKLAVGDINLKAEPAGKSKTGNTNKQSSRNTGKSRSQGKAAEPKSAVKKTATKKAAAKKAVTKKGATKAASKKTKKTAKSK